MDPFQLAEAADPHTSPARLAELGAEGSPVEIRQRVAGNPNLSAETLLALCAAYPAEAFANPAFELYCLQDPRFLISLPDEAQDAAAEAPGMPRAVVDYLFERGSDYLHKLMAANPATPPWMLRQFAVDKYDFVREPTATNPATPPAWLALLVRAGSRPSLESWQDRWGEVSLDELAELRASGVWGRCLVARHPQTPASWLPELLDASQGDEETETRRALASSPRSPPEVLSRLIGDESVEVYPEVAANPVTPLSLLPALMARECEIVYHNLSCSPRTPGEILRVLSTDWFMLTPHVLEHPNLEPEWRALVRRAGLDQREPSAASAAPLSAAELTQLSGGGYRARRFVASHPSTPPPVIQRLLADKDERVLAALVVAPTLREEERRQLLEAPERHDLVHRALAASPRCSPSLLALLAATADRATADLLLARPDFPAPLCALLASERHLAPVVVIRRGDDPAVIAALQAAGVDVEQAWGEWQKRQERLRTRASSPEPRDRQRAAVDRDTPHELLRQLLDDPEKRVIDALECNPALPPDIDARLREMGRIPGTKSLGG